MDNTLIKIDPLDVNLVDQVTLDYLQIQAKDLKIVDETSAKTGLSMALQARKMEATIEERKKEITKPHLDFQRKINKIASNLKSILENIENNLQQRLAVWFINQDNEEFFSIDSLEVEDGKVWLYDEYDFTIDDLADIPTKYILPDHKEIERAIKEGVRNIPGIAIFKSKKLKMRVKN